MTPLDILSLGAVAAETGAHMWQVRRLFERGDLPPATRVGPYRVVSLADLPLIREALRKSGYLPIQEVAHAG
jgi:hypothetical protein